MTRRTMRRTRFPNGGCEVQHDIHPPRTAIPSRFQYYHVNTEEEDIASSHLTTLAVAAPREPLALGTAKPMRIGGIHQARGAGCSRDPN